MFDKLKQLNDLKKIQGQLEQEEAEFENNGVKVIINGKMQVKEISLNKELSKEDQEETVKDCINGAMKKMQTIAAQKMFNM